EGGGLVVERIRVARGVAALDLSLELTSRQPGAQRRYLLRDARRAQRREVGRMARAAVDLRRLGLQRKDGGERLDGHRMAQVPVEDPDVQVAAVGGEVLDAADDVEAQAAALARVPEERADQLPGGVAPLQAAAVAHHQVCPTVAVDQVAADGEADLLAQLALRSEESLERMHGEEQAIDDV